MRKEQPAQKPKPVQTPKPKPVTWWSGIAAMAQLGLPQK